jgi:potassium-transporting ATPase KdpC subunit
MDITLRQSWIAVRFLLVMTLVLGVGYPVAVYAVGRVVPGTADGSFVTDPSGAVVGSSLIGQTFDGPTWFHARPSAAGDGYDALSSSGSNLGASSADLVTAVTARKAAIAAEEGVDPITIPADAVTASASGLDPDISPEYAAIQVARVAKARNLDPARVQQLVDASTTGRTLVFMGEPRVNVLQLNLALESLR